MPRPRPPTTFNPTRQQLISLISHRSVRTQSRTYENASSSPATDGSGPGERVSGSGWGLALGSPRQLVQYLDSFVVGQERAKKVLSVAVFNHYNRIRAKLQREALEDPPISPGWRDNMAADSDSDPQSSSHVPIHPHPYRRQLPPNPFQTRSNQVPLFEKSNVLIIGPTGSGKTLLARTLAKVLDVPFAMSDATTFTQAGYVGEDVEMCIHRLLQASSWDVHRASIGIVCIDEADKLARRTGPSSDMTKDVSGEGVQQGLLRMLEGSVVNVQAKGFENVNGGGAVGGDIVGGASGAGGSGSGGKGRKSGLASSPKSETYQVDTSDILFILSGAFVGLDKVVRNRVSKGSIGFGAPLATDLDEQLTAKSGAGFIPFFTPNKKEKAVNLLDMVEPVDLIKYGFIPEFTSRLPTITSLHPLTTSDLMRVLTEVRGALAKQYEALFGYSGVEIRFTTSALREICEMATKRGMGARGLRGIMETLLLEPMYDVPGSSVRYVLIDQAVVKGEREALYYSRGQGGLFYSALAAEEEKDAKERGEIPPVENGDSEEELMKEVRLREAERDSSRKARVKGGVGSSWRLSSP